MATVRRFLIVFFLSISVCVLGIWIIGLSSSETYHASKTGRYIGTPEEIWHYIREGEPSANMQIESNYRVVSSTAFQHLATSVHSPNFNVNVKWEYSLSPVSDTVTEITIAETLTVKNEWVRGLLVLTGRNSQLKQEHRHLADKFEFGE